MLSELYFIFKGTDSRVMGVRVLELPPYTMPARRYEAQTVPARSGTLHMWDGSYESVMLPIRVYLPYEQEGAVVAEFTQIARWLDGSGWLELSDRPGRRWWATISLETPYNAWVQGFADRLGTVTFTADPWAWHVDNVPVTLTASGSTLRNPGSETAAPLIEIYGSGAFHLAIGQQIVEFAGVAAASDGGASITLDCAIERAFRGDTALDDRMTGDFPLLPPGDCFVSWVVPEGETGQVDKVAITVNARSLP